jgi:hypothetical protein
LLALASFPPPVSGVADTVTGMASDHEHGQDIFINADGSEEYREPWVVTADDALQGDYSGSICVHEGATFEVGARGTHSGSLTLRPGSRVRIIGTHSGSLRVSRGAAVEVTGHKSGSVHVERGALVKVQPGGRLSGSLHVAGLIENRGTRGGSVHMSGGEIRDLDGGTVKQPTRSSDGISVYYWND